MSDYYTQDFTDLRVDGHTRIGGDVDHCIPRFFLTERMRDNDIVPMEMVEIITPGDRLSRPIQRVTDEHRKRWPRQYQAFKSGVEPGIEGTPVAQWSEIDWSLRDELRGAGFQTLEQLATAHDGQINGVTNGALWRRKAQIFLEKNKVVAKKDTQIAELMERLKALEAKYVPTPSGSGDVAPKRRGGRPRKAGVSTGQPVVSGGMANVSSSAS